MPDEPENPTPENPETPATPDPVADQLAEIAAARADLTTREQALTEQLANAAATEQRAAADVTAANAALDTARQGQLEAHRRALLAENAGQLVPELVAGASADELEASVTTAREAFTRIAESVRAAAPTPVQVPTGASPRQAPDVEALSPLEKMTRALTRANGRG